MSRGFDVKTRAATRATIEGLVVDAIIRIMRRVCNDLEMAIYTLVGRARASSFISQYFVCKFLYPAAFRAVAASTDFSQLVL